jgi:hypothetical protein
MRLFFHFLQCVLRFLSRVWVPRCFPRKPVTSRPNPRLPNDVIINILCPFLVFEHSYDDNRLHSGYQLLRLCKWNAVETTLMKRKMHHIARYPFIFGKSIIRCKEYCPATQRITNHDLYETWWLRSLCPFDWYTQRSMTIVQQYDSLRIRLVRYPSGQLTAHESMRSITHGSERQQWEVGEYVQAPLGMNVWRQFRSRWGKSI